MTRSKYPLEALARLREDKADASARELAEAVREREAATQRRVHADRELGRHDDASREVRDAERDLLTSGALTVADLMRAEAWEARVRAEAAELAARRASAASGEGDALSGEDRARAELAQHKADLDVVEKDKARFVDRARKAQEARDEEGAAEAWRPRRA